MDAGAFAHIVESMTVLRTAIADFARARADDCTRSAAVESVDSAADVIRKDAAAWAACAEAASAPLRSD